FVESERVKKEYRIVHCDRNAAQNCCQKRRVAHYENINKEYACPPSNNQRGPIDGCKKELFQSARLLLNPHALAYAPNCRTEQDYENKTVVEKVEGTSIQTRPGTWWCKESYAESEEEEP